MDYKIGTVVNGKVTGIQSYGAFVSLDEHTQGLIHISEVQHGYIKNINDVLSIGQQVEVKVIDIDEYSRKISLSIRALENQPAFREQPYRKKRFFTNRHKHIGFRTLETALPIWIEEALNEFQR